MDEDRRLANNPFARALDDEAQRPVPDDEKATRPIRYVAVGLLSLVLFAVFVAAMVLPPMFMHTLILRGARTGRPGMLAAGVVLGVVYFLMLYSTGKRLMGRPKSPPTD